MAPLWPYQKRLRYEVLRRDNHTCRYCGAAAPDVKLTVDHVLPTSLGGRDEASNLVAACRDCNAGKSSSSADAALVDDVGQDALRWSKAMERAAEIQRGRREDLEFAVTHLGSWWEDVWLTDDKYPHDYVPLMEMVRDNRGHVAWDQKWKYFAGCVWNVLRERQEIASDLLEVDDGGGNATQ